MPYTNKYWDNQNSSSDRGSWYTLYDRDAQTIGRGIQITESGVCMPERATSDQKYPFTFIGPINTTKYKMMTITMTGSHYITFHFTNVLPSVVTSYPNQRDNKYYQSMTNTVTYSITGTYLALHSVSGLITSLIFTP